MTEERPVDLRGLDVDAPDVARASIKRFRRRILILGAWVLVFALAGLAIGVDTVHKREQNPIALIATAPSLNTSLGNYRVGSIDVGLLSVVALPHGQIGMKFVLHSDEPLGNCCGIYPRIATFTMGLTSEPSSRFAEVLLANPASIVSQSGTIDLLLTRGLAGSSEIVGRFTVDLHALGVRVPGG
jgi:hypothetical protein